MMVLARFMPCLRCSFDICAFMLGVVKKTHGWGKGAVVAPWRSRVLRSRNRMLVVGCAGFEAIIEAVESFASVKVSQVHGKSLLCPSCNSQAVASSPQPSSSVHRDCRKERTRRVFVRQRGLVAARRDALFGQVSCAPRLCRLQGQAGEWAAITFTCAVCAPPAFCGIANSWLTRGLCMPACVVGQHDHAERHGQGSRRAGRVQLGHR